MAAVRAIMCETEYLTSDLDKLIKQRESCVLMYISRPQTGCSCIERRCSGGHTEKTIEAIRISGNFSGLENRTTHLKKSPIPGNMRTVGCLPAIGSYYQLKQMFILRVC